MSAFRINYEHRVRTIHPGSKGTEEDNLAVPIHYGFGSWLSSRPDRHRYPGRPYPVVLVLGEGGGIRAAYDLSYLVAWLEDEVPGFRNHVFAISAVSGGAIGASVYLGLCKLAKDELLTPGTSWRQNVDGILGDDLLTPPLAALFGPEVLQYVSPFTNVGTDRAIAIEDALSDSFKKVTGSDALSGPLRWFYGLSSSTDLPIVLMNATSARSGTRVVISPNALPGDTAAKYPFASLGAPSIRLSTAAFISARFPIISPPANIVLPSGKIMPLVDGGYFDNTGSVTLARVVRQIADERAKNQADDYEILILARVWPFSGDIREQFCEVFE